MLGEHYFPQGKAKETAQRVLEVDNPMACNVGLGCSNDCGYCFGSRAYYKSDWKNVRRPKCNPLDLVKSQNLRPEGVFLCFGTDPFLKANREATLALLEYFRDRNIRTATLSKVDVPDIRGNRNGMTIVSLDKEFNRIWEARAPLSIERVKKLKAMHDQGEYTWVSVEPFSPPEIWKEDLSKLLEAIGFVDFMIFGKWNYDRRASTREAKSFYRDKAAEFREYCEARKIRYWIKGNESY
jgi:DNA repair photolyase